MVVFVGIGLTMLIGQHGVELNGLNRRNWPRIRCCVRLWRRNCLSGGHLNRWSSGCNAHTLMTRRCE